MNAKTAMVALTILTFAVSPATAGDPKGTWLTARGDAHIKIVNCADAYCGTVAWLQQPLDPQTGQLLTDKQNPDTAKRGRPVVEIQILLGMRPSGEDRWSGHIYNSSDGNTYEGNVSIVNAGTLRIEGCLFGFCQSQNWERLN